jgi:hypothetical protein
MSSEYESVEASDGAAGPQIFETGDLLRMLAREPHLAEHVDDLSFFLPRWLTGVASEVIELVRTEQWEATKSGDFRAVEGGLYGGVSNHTSTPSIRLDVRAKELITQRVKSLGFTHEPWFVGEELPIEQRSDRPVGLTVFVLDGLDGSTKAKTTGEGFASVIVAFIVTRHGLRLVGGAIATSVDSVRFTFDGSGRYTISRPGDRTFVGLERTNVVDHDRPRSRTLAMVTGGAIDKADYLNRIAAKASAVLDKPFQIEATGGNPKLYPLVGLKLDTLLEPRPTKPYDSALLIPLLVSPGVTVWNLWTNRKMTPADVMRAFRSYIDSGGDNTRRDMPPYLVCAAPKPVGDAVRQAVAQVGVLE